LLKSWSRWEEAEKSEVFSEKRKKSSRALPRESPSISLSMYNLCGGTLGRYPYVK